MNTSGANQAFGKEVVAIKSADGSYFVVGKNDSGYYLRNKYTSIPNEFNIADEAAVKKLFEDLCDRIPECVRVDYPSGHPNSCMRVVFEDKTEQVFKEGENASKNLCAYTHNTARYSDFQPEQYSWIMSDLITLDHIRWVCKDKQENYDVFFQAIKTMKEDDGIWIFDTTNPDGSIEIHVKVWTIDEGPIVTILPNGKIEKTGGLKFVEVLKAYDVKVLRCPY